MSVLSDWLDGCQEKVPVWLALRSCDARAWFFCFPSSLLITRSKNKLLRVHLRCSGQVEGIVVVGGISHVKIDQLL